MFPRVPMLRPLLLAGLVLAATGTAGAQLAAKSPFVPPAAAAVNAPTAGGPLEYRGFIETGNGVQFRVYDSAKKLGAWVKLNERNPEFDLVAKEYNDSNKTLTVEHQGRVLTLAERQAKVVSSGTAAQAIPPPQVASVAPANVPPAVTQAVVLNPSPADEQRRLEAVAAEVSRRRALREQATQQISQGVPQPVSPPQPPPQPQRNFQPPPNNQPGKRF